MILIAKRPELVIDTESNVFVQPQALTPEECAKLTHYGEVNKQIDQSRHAGRHEVCGLDSSEEIHNKLFNVWESAINFFDSRINFVETYLLKKYTAPGGFFGKHTDHYKCIKGNLDRKLSLVIQLTEHTEYKGGALIIEGVKTPNFLGTAIVFPSCFVHEVRPVTFGARWSLITFAWGPAF